VFPCFLFALSGKEWEVFTDKHGVTFYRNAITKQCEYERPHDAVNVKPAEMLCSAYQVHACLKKDILGRRI
jgi:hypothetical protein